MTAPQTTDDLIAEGYREGLRDAATGPLLLTARGQRALERYIARLIDVAAQGNTWGADIHAADVLAIIARNRRKG